MKRRVAVVTGSRADFGLLTPVMLAIRDRPELELLVVAAGSHMVPPAPTFRDVRALFDVADSVPMQVAGRTSRPDDAEATGRGLARFARCFDRLRPDWVVVLGDRIEAFAAAAAASIGGVALAHIHGGDRAEGIADEALRHAITKLAHLHLAATETSAGRIRRMGEPAERVHVTGSPAIDGLAQVEPLTDDAAADLGDPELVLLVHPSGLPTDSEHAVAESAAGACAAAAGRVLWLAPNLDPGRDAIEAVRGRWCDKPPAVAARFTGREHLPRDVFLRLLRRTAERGGLLVGNSSAGLIEAAALGVRSVNIGPRQAGRERPGSVIDAAEDATPAALAGLAETIRRAVRLARETGPYRGPHPYGDGRAGPNIARLLAETSPAPAGFTRKRFADGP